MVIWVRTLRLSPPVSQIATASQNSRSVAELPFRDTLTCRGTPILRQGRLFTRPRGGEEFAEHISDQAKLLAHPLFARSRLSAAWASPRRRRNQTGQPPPGGDGRWTLRTQPTGTSTPASRWASSTGHQKRIASTLSYYFGGTRISARCSTFPLPSLASIALKGPAVYAPGEG